MDESLARLLVGRSSNELVQVSPHRVSDAGSWQNILLFGKNILPTCSLSDFLNSRFVKQYCVACSTSTHSSLHRADFRFVGSN
jgi:hypothetical protein